MLAADRQSRRPRTGAGSCAAPERPAGTGAEGAIEDTVWYRIGQFAMRRAVLVVIAVVALLALLGAPFLIDQVRFPGRPGAAGVGPPHEGAAGDPRRLQAEPVGVSTVVVTAPTIPTACAARSYSQDLSLVGGVDAVTSSAGLFVQSAGGRGDAADTSEERRDRHRVLVAGTDERRTAELVGALARRRASRTG